MYCQIKFSKSVRASIKYNEKKCVKGEAWCLQAENFLKENHRLSMKEKVQWMERLTCLNELAEKKAIHLTLNFSPADEQLQNDYFLLTADRYMEAMGLGLAPYLVYRHYDAGHPHLHIVTPKIWPNGDIIRWNRKDYYRSQQICRGLEKDFMLTPSLPMETKAATEARERKMASAQIVQYGEAPLMPAISKVLDHVINKYYFTSFDEFNAILRVYNIRADNGSEGSLLQRKKGLLYRALDKTGKDIGVPLKASLFNCNPTLRNLEQQFMRIDPDREINMSKARMGVDGSFFKGCQSLEELGKRLRPEGISIVVRQDKKEGPPNIYYVDHKERCVFKGSALGERYTLKAILERCEQGLSLQQEQQLVQRKRRGLG